MAFFVFFYLFWVKDSFNKYTLAHITTETKTGILESKLLISQCHFLNLRIILTKDVI